MNIFKKIMQWSLPSAVFFEDGSRVDYLSKSGTLVYVSPTGHGIRMPVVYDQSNGELQIEMPVVWQWDKPVGIVISEDEIKDIKTKIFQYVEKQGKSFSLR